ncbi:prolyl-tRNA synthetase [Caballeronia udeis]|uniref:Proline--tRNA ligase n=1 Tax=Caballeronia udeis TaxID=1232866 RepID=A0ABW8MQ07_9BURK
MTKMKRNAISPTRAENYAEWYQQVIDAADLAENSPVRGCMVIKPWGYALWENMQRELDDMFKATGHRNAYFPLLIPMSLLEKEAEHVDGFAKECAVVTHHRLIHSADGTLIPDPSAELEESLVIRPTSETIVGVMFAKWIQSYRDLPLLINQWANVFRWEMRTRLFLRTSEFLWQEGHTAHETESEAREEATRMLDIYTRFVEDCLAIPVIQGAKSDSERFPGAIDTYTIEAMMGDCKALQAGTSHFLGQNFAKAAGIEFQGREPGSRQFAWTTSWGASTRLIGALIMVHGDDDGLVLPPNIAPAQVVILPIHRSEDINVKTEVDGYVDLVASQLRAMHFGGRRVRVEIDRRESRGGQKQWEWIKKGVPVRIEIGLRDRERGSVTLSRRDRDASEKISVLLADIPETVTSLFDEIQRGCLERARQFRSEHTRVISDKGAFEDFFRPQAEQQTDVRSGFALAAWCGDKTCESWVKETLNVTIRCLPFDPPHDDIGVGCVVCGKPGSTVALFARNY